MLPLPTDTELRRDEFIIDFHYSISMNFRKLLKYIAPSFDLKNRLSPGEAAKRKTKRRKMIYDILCFTLIIPLLFNSIQHLLNYEEFKSELINAPRLFGGSQKYYWLLPVFQLALIPLIMINRTRLQGLILNLLLQCQILYYYASVTHITQWKSVYPIAGKIYLPAHEMVFIYCINIVLTISGIIVNRKIKSVV